MSCKISHSEQNRLLKSAISKIQKGYYQEAIEKLEKLLIFTEPSSNLQLLAIGNLSFCLIYQRKFKKSLTLLSKTLSESSVPACFKLGLLLNLSVGFSLTNNHSTSLKYSLKALHITENLQNPEIRALILYNIAISYFSMKNLSKSLQFFRLGLNLSRKIPDSLILTQLFHQACLKCLPQVPARPKHNRTSSQNLIGVHQGWKKNVQDSFGSFCSLNSASGRSFQEGVKGSSFNNILALTGNESSCFLDSSKTIDEPCLNQKIKRIRSEISKCFKVVDDFCEKEKECLREIFQDSQEKYLKNIDKIRKIQRWFRKNRKIKILKVFPGFSTNRIIRSKFCNNLKKSSSKA
jgi:tetratricopeptide (TPR) repeat protein